VWCVALRTVAAQDVPRRAGPAEDSQTPAESPVKEVQPPVLLLRNQAGDRLQAVLGFTLEDFERFIAQRAQLGLGQQPPRFQLERLSGHGEAHERHADLTLELTVGVNHTGWVRIPLRLAEAAMRAKPRYEGPGEQRVEFDAANSEYALWLRGQGDEPHKITLDLAVPLEKSSDQTELKLGMPRAAVSELVLQVADPQAEATVRKGGLLDATRHGKNDTKFTILGMERDFAVAWRKQSAQPTDAPAPLEASGVFDVRIDRTGVHSDVQLTIRSFATRIDTFRLRLPAGTSLTTAEQAGYAIAPVADGAAGEGDHQQLYEVRLREKAAGPTQIRFVTDTPLDEADRGPKFALTGVELVGAARQSGYLVVRVADDWQVDWESLQQARQIDEPPVDLDREGVLATFEYFSQPFAVVGHLAPLKTHFSVEPRYTVQVDPQQLRLEARLGYQIRGAKAFALQVEMPGWELDDVGPRSLLDVDRVSVEAGRPLRLPLLQPTTGAAEVIIRAHRTLPADSTQVAFDLPRPQADSLAPSQVLVVPAENVALTVREPDLVGLTRLRGETAPAGAAGNNRALVFRGQAPRQHFNAELLLETRAVTAQVSSRLQMEPRGAKLEETIAFDIAHEPLTELLLEVPSWLATSDRVEWELDGQAVAPTTTDRESPVEGAVLFHLPLTEKRLGKCALVVRYPLRYDTIEADADTAIDVPLVMPAATELTSNEISIAATPGLIVEQRDAAWTQETATADRGTSGWRFSHNGASGELALRGRLQSSVAVDPTVVERAWIQTRLSAGERWDRAVFEFSSSQRRLNLRLPPGAIAGEAQVLLDGQPVTPLNPGREILAVELASEASRHVLDVSYRFATRSDQRGELTFVPPIFGDNPWIRQTYWQLILPRDEHLVDWSDELTAAYSWQFHRGLWMRQPTVEQQQLEAWTHATAGPDVPAQANRYVLTSLGPIEQLQVYTVSRALLILTISGGVLAAGLLLMYLKPLRHPTLLFGAGIVLATFALLYPEPAVLMGQVAALGAGLVLISLSLERLLAARRRPPLVVRSTPSGIHEPGSTRTHLRSQSSPGAIEGGTLVSQSTGTAGDS